MIQQTAPDGAAETPSGENKKSSKKLRLISTLFMLVLIAVTFYIIFRETSLNEIWTAIQTSNPLWLLAALGASIFASVMFGVALHIALRALYKKPISLMRNIGLATSGNITPALPRRVSRGSRCSSTICLPTVSTYPMRRFRCFWSTRRISSLCC